MTIIPSGILPKNILTLLKRSGNHIAVSTAVIEAARSDYRDLLLKLKTRENGLSGEEAEERLETHGPNVVTQERRSGRLMLFVKACMNPLVILLLCLSSIEFYTADYRAGAVMLGMVVLGVVLRFVQEAKADDAAAKLKAMISVTATVVRDGEAKEIPLAELVPGDIVKLAAGDMIPADLRIITCKDLFLIQSSLTGESFPVEKFEGSETNLNKPAHELKNVCFLGTSVESGTALGVIVETGVRTFLGSMAKSIVEQRVHTSFDRGVSKFTWLMIFFMAVMVPLVFVINGVTKHDWTTAFFFAVTVAVGMTPEMLPMIVSVCLSRGAIAMSKKKVIVKRLNSIQNLGAMDVLCTDKTGTLTMDRVILERHCDVVRQDDDGVLAYAYLNSHFQTGLKNVLDRAILDHREIHESFAIDQFQKADEIPFDFSRKIMSVVVETPERKFELICKGAPESVFDRCDRFELDGRIYPIEQLLVNELKEEYDELSSEGFRVLAIAYKELDRRPAYSKDDEKDMILKGYVAFLDPPKDTAVPAISALQTHGVSVKILTGDNELISRKICHEVGLATDNVLAGQQVEAMGDDDAFRPHVARRQAASHSCAAKQEARRRIPWRRHQRLARSPRVGRRNFGRYGDGHREGSRRRDSARKKLDGSRRRRARRAESVRQHPEIHPDGREFEFRQHVQRGRGERVFEISAHFADAASDEHLALRFFAGADSGRRRRSRTDRQASSLAYRRDREVYFLHRALQFDLRLHDIFHHAVRFRLLERRSGRACIFGRAFQGYRRCEQHVCRTTVPNRLVRRVAADANADHSRHPHEPHPVPAKPCKLAADFHDRGDHGVRSVAAVVPDRSLAGLRAVAAAVLFSSDLHAALLCVAHPGSQNLAVAKRMDMTPVALFR
jgi:high-affinity K+ transport system ATPase subunit B